MFRRILHCLRLRYGLRRALLGPRFPMATRCHTRARLRTHAIERDGLTYVEPRPSQ